MISTSINLDHILTVSLPIILSWLTYQHLLISPQVTDYQSNMISESAVRDKWLFRLNAQDQCHEEILSCPKTKLATHELQI